MKKLFPIILFATVTSCEFVIDKRERLPSFNLLMLDSITVFNTDSIPEGKPFVVMYFSPDCDHCQGQVEDILNNMNSFRNIQFYFFTPFRFELLKPFYKYYHLYNFPNITLGYDHNFFIPMHFKAKSTPSVFIYNKNKKLESVYEGGLKSSELIKAISKN